MTWSCPIPDDDAVQSAGMRGDEIPRVSLTLGEGGRAMRRWLETEILPRFANAELLRQQDAARFAVGREDVLISTDSYVVTPRFFPGGNLGKLAVYGTANDLAVSGARPEALCLAWMIEEGLPLAELHSLLDEVKQAAAETGIEILGGDTKVVPRGAVDGVFITSTGIGRAVMSLEGPERLTLGDELLVTGPVGRHGLAVLCAREGIEFEPQPVSDCAALWPAVEALHEAGISVRAMRDATRGGVAAVLHEWAGCCPHTLQLDRSRLPSDPVTRGVAELLGLDSLHVACEGTMVLAVASAHAEAALRVLRQVEVSRAAARIGTVVERLLAPVVCANPFGQPVPLDEPAGAPLPRIC